MAKSPDFAYVAHRCIRRFLNGPSGCGEGSKSGCTIGCSMRVVLEPKPVRPHFCTHVWCYCMLGKNCDAGTYSFICCNHFLKLLCCYLELRFFEGTDSEHAALPVHCSVTGTAVSPPLTCSSGSFYKQMNAEWISVVKKKNPKKNMTLNIMRLMASRSYLKFNGRLFPTQPTQTSESGYCQLLQCFT